VTVEAMASGLAVVAYDYAAAAEYIVHDQNGLLVGYDDAEGFVGQAAALVQDRQRIRDLGSRARVEQFETLLLAAAGAQPPEPGSVIVGAVTGAGGAGS